MSFAVAHILFSLAAQAFAAFEGEVQQHYHHKGGAYYPEIVQIVSLLKFPASDIAHYGEIDQE